MAEEGTSPQKAFTGRGPLNLLIAEDNPGDVHLIKYALESTGQTLEFQVAKDGAIALDMLFEAAGHRERLDLLLLDINLPRYDGYEILVRMRQDEWLAKLPVIVLSTSPADVIEEGLNRVSARVAGFYSKPAHLDEYLQLGRDILDSFFRAKSAEAS